MTIRDIALRLQAAANGSVSADELRKAAVDLFGRKGTLERLLAEAHFVDVARCEGGRCVLWPAFLDRVRRDYAGPIDLTHVDLSCGESVVTVEDGGARRYVAISGALPSLIYWLAQQMAPAEGGGADESGQSS